MKVKLKINLEESTQIQNIHFKDKILKEFSLAKANNLN